MNKVRELRKKSKIFLISSFIGLITVLIFSITISTITLSKKSETIISEVGSLYMQGISKEISMHFETTIDLRFNQLETILMSDNLAHKEQTPDKIHDILSYEGKIRNFECLGLLTDSGDIQMIYGDNVSLVDPEPFLNSLRKKQTKVAIGKTQSGDDVILMGIYHSFPINENENSIALVAGVPVSYIDYILSLDTDDSTTLTYSHIIRRDGSFIIRSAEVKEDNFFDRIKASYDDYNAVC